MNVDRANTMLAQAARILEHVEGKNKSHTAMVAQVRNLVDSAAFALAPEPAPLPMPEGARSGISVESRAEWRR